MLFSKTRKRKVDKLVTAETISAGRLREASTIKSDESTLIHIADKDCAAVEVKCQTML